MSKIKRGSREQHSSLWALLTTAGKCSGINLYFPRKVLNWPHSALALAVEGNTSNSQKFPKRTGADYLPPSFGSPVYYTSLAIVCAILIVLQGSSIISKMPGEENKCLLQLKLFDYFKPDLQILLPVPHCTCVSSKEKHMELHWPAFSNPGWWEQEGTS